MSSKRNADMAAIREMLADTDVPVSTTAETFLPSGPIADAIPNPTPETPEKKAADKLAAKTETEDLKLIKEQESLVKAQLRQTAQTTLRAANSVKGGIGGLSIPGGLGVPLGVLLVLWMILIKVNGNSRFGWMWLVMTGNAELQQDVSGSGGSGGETPEQQDMTEPGILYTAHTIYEYLPPIEMDEW